MKYLFSSLIIIGLAGCSKDVGPDSIEILFLHHSTGHTVWLGSTSPYIYRVTNKGGARKFFSDYNSSNNTKYLISDLTFPKKEPYGWNNYPYDYS